MMDVYILGVVCVGLCLWVMYLQNRLRKLYSILNDTTDLIIDMAEGKAEVHVNRTDRVITVRAHKKEVV